MRFCVTYVPPHPGPLPPGEGGSPSALVAMSASRFTERAARCPLSQRERVRVRENAHPLPAAHLLQFTFGPPPAVARPKRDQPTLPQIPSRRNPVAKHYP